MSFAAYSAPPSPLLGAPAFLIADSLLKQAGNRGWESFPLPRIGLAVSVVGTLFMLLAGRFILPERPRGDTNSESFRLDGYYTEILVFGGIRFSEKV